ncbi:MAG: aldehyde ferredoxin oxidoreductase, partial [Dehalococcoidia bacterium]|nr:aldehyde ferredoxin oxidoreductase [Dehalococcoidia bacterium]
MKFAGFDGLVLKGEAEKPVYLFLYDGVCEIRNTAHLWGKGTMHTQQILKDELGVATRVMTICPVGENKVTFATL